VYRAVTRIRSPRTTPVIRAYSRLGEHGLVWFAAGTLGMAVDRRNRVRWRRAILAVLTAQLTSSAIKVAIGRPRPVIDSLPHLISTPTGLSFPSSHASGSFAAARAYAPLVGALPVYLAATTMGLSRIHLGVHYPSDVAAGAALGSIIGSFGR
jgi:undecaprenyl-diphosphatase